MHTNPLGASLTYPTAYSYNLSKCVLHCSILHLGGSILTPLSAIYFLFSNSYDPQWLIKSAMVLDLLQKQKQKMTE